MTASHLGRVRCQVLALRYMGPEVLKSLETLHEEATTTAEGL